MTRTVFDNDMTAHAWAHGNGAARSHNGNLYAQGATLFSYGSHFPLGIRLPYDAPGGAAFVLNADSYSVSTARHKQCAARATHGPVCRVPHLAQIRRALESFANGRGDSDAARHVRQHLESDKCSGMSEEGVALVLSLIGSKASPARVLAKAKKAEKARRDKRAKAERARRVEFARRILNTPLSAFDGTGRTISERACGVYDIGQVPTEIARAWKAAKASGWGEKRLKALRQRERALRDNLQEVKARHFRQVYNDHARSSIATLRRLCGSKPVSEALESGSLELRIEIARGLVGLGHKQPATLGARGADWMELLRHARRVSDEASRIRSGFRSRVAQYQRANALELWRAGEIHTGLLPHNLRQYNGAMLRAVNVRRNESGAITGGELQTSGGARVPLTHAVRLFRFLKSIRSQLLPATEEAWQRNGLRARVGSFEVDTIYGDGSFRAGCHFIQWAEVRDLAEALGVFRLSPSDDILEVHEAA